MGFSRESDLPLGGRSRSTLGSLLVSVEFSAADMFVEFSPLPSRSWVHMSAHTKSTSGTMCPSSCGEKGLVWGWAGL